MNNKEKYRAYCKAQGAALYQNAWWLDAVCGNNWDAVFYEDKGALAFPIKKKYGLKLISMPMLTLCLGPVISQTANENRITQELLKQLPAFDLLDLYFSSSFTSSDILKENGFKTNIRQSYHLHDISALDKVFAAFNSSTRQQIRKAEKNVEVAESNDVEMLYKMVSLTFKRQDKKTPYSLAYVKSIYEACHKNKACKILVAKDAEGNTHGACLLAWDKQCAYYVMGGSDPKYKSSAAYSLLMWAAIQEASSHCKEFDFCGSSLPGVARFFSGFGSTQVPYLHIKKVNSKALKLVLKLKGQ